MTNNKTKTNQQRKKRLNLYNSYLYILIFFPALCFLLLYGNEAIIIIFDLINVKLYSFDQVSTTIQIGLTFATAFILILNLIQQREEFDKINETSLKSNDLQVILYEKQAVQSQQQILIDEIGELHFANYWKILNDNLSHIINAKEVENVDDYYRLAIDTANANSIDTLHFFIRLDAKIRVLELNLSDKDSLYLFVDTLKPYLMGFLYNIYNQKTKSFFDSKINDFIGEYDKEFYRMLVYIMNKTPSLENYIKYYFKSIKINNE